MTVADVDLSYKWMNTATDYTGISLAHTLLESWELPQEIYVVFVMAKDIIAEDSGGNLTKDFYNTHIHENKNDYGTTKSTKTKAF